MQEEPAVPANTYNTDDQISLQVQTSQKGLLGDNIYKNLHLNVIKLLPSRNSFKNFDPSPSAKFRQIAEKRDEISRSVPSSNQPSTKHFHVPFAKEINWALLRDMGKRWIRDPMNMALLAWILCVAISGAILFMVMTGMLNAALPKKSQRDTWFEISNQIINALFALMCLYQHPKRFYHLALLLRWAPEDVVKLRKIYCKNGTYKPNEWVHMMVVVVLLHLNCFAQYALCGLNWGYPRSKRPAIGVGICISVAMGAPAFACVYSILSPLGREYETEVDPEAHNLKTLEKRYSFVVRDEHRVAVARPEWIGGLFDFWDDITTAYLSFFCCFCVFGWNMDRLGFGNMYVHIVTFLLFCLAPFFIFNLAATNINNEAVREALGITGIFLCLFGLLYGGFWRIRMRKRFNLPGNTFCCGNPSVTDCFQWLCCCSCSLAQEIRTGDYYDVIEDKFYVKQTNEDNQLALSPMPREDGLALFTSSPSSPYIGKLSPSRFKIEATSTPTRSPILNSPQRNLSRVEEESSMITEGNSMGPPIPFVIRRDENLSIAER